MTNQSDPQKHAFIDAHVNGILDHIAELRASGIKQHPVVVTVVQPTHATPDVPATPTPTPISIPPAQPIAQAPATPHSAPTVTHTPKRIKSQPAPIILRSLTDGEQRIEKYVIKHRQRKNRWPTILNVASGTNNDTDTILGILLKSDVLDYTVPAKPVRNNVDAVIHWSVELKEAV